MDVRLLKQPSHVLAPPCLYSERSASEPEDTGVSESCAFGIEVES